MGADGGVIAVERKFLRHGQTAKEERKDAAAEAELAAFRLTHCALSSEPLEAPIVADELGNLFKKDVVIARLLERNLPEELAHLRGLKDVVACRFTPLSAATEDGAAYMCPVTRVALAGRTHFSVLRTTGFVLSDQAVKEMGVTALQDEYGPFDLDDVIRLAPDADELARLRERLQQRRERAKAEKRGRKKGKKRRREAALEDELLEDGGRKPEAKAVEPAEEGALDQTSGKDGLVGISPLAKAARRERKPGQAAAAASAGRTKGSALAQDVTAAAKAAVSAQSRKGDIYKNLFSKKDEKDKDSNDLFIRTAGHAYTS